MASRKDYVRMAEVIAQVKSERDRWPSCQCTIPQVTEDKPNFCADCYGYVDVAHQALTRIAECIAWEFKTDNANFSFQRFFAATGLPLPASLEGKR